MIAAEKKEQIYDIVDFLKNIRTTYHITFQLKNIFFFIWKNQVKINFISQSIISLKRPKFGLKSFATSWGKYFYFILFI